MTDPYTTCHSCGSELIGNGVTDPATGALVLTCPECEPGGGATTPVKEQRLDLFDYGATCPECNRPNTDADLVLAEPDQPKVWLCKCGTVVEPEEGSPDDSH